MHNRLDRRQFIGSCAQAALLCLGHAACPLAISRADARSLSIRKGYIRKKLSPYYTELSEQVIRCELCPHHCEVAPGERGLCEVRKNEAGKYYSLVYANPCAVHVDPIEKKPFFHVLPGTQSFSLATAGCNFDCKFCQNWNISQARPEETENYQLSPNEIVSLATEYKCRSIASTYVEPTIFMEYMLDIGRAAQSRPLLKVMHSNGYVASRPLADLCEVLDAACIDLKGFTEVFYRDMTEGSLAPVLATLKELARRKIHTELVNLVIPGWNDQMDIIRDMCRWIVDTLGPGVPLHFTRFSPRYKLKSLPPTPIETLEQARKTAMDQGLHFVYIGNVYRHPAENTY
ncbi:MAG: AmmeMemoRadiSam system radical SAM enzyme, partial [Deltaproteobacteria bacterium]|nr:AmmeMemoRadiSam system radical SAM enzyme [Deltaproteobacteria bacterium]